MTAELKYDYDHGWKNGHKAGTRKGAGERDRLKAINTELLRVLETIIANARLEPDPRMTVFVGCFMLPVDDIDTARAAIAKAKGD